jgi:hypothetical protein
MDTLTAEGRHEAAGDLAREMPLWSDWWNSKVISLPENKIFMSFCHTRHTTISAYF